MPNYELTPHPAPDSGNPGFMGLLFRAGWLTLMLVLSGEIDDGETAQILPAGLGFRVALLRHKAILFGRDGGPYADEVDARQREVNRARAEGREPDLDNPPPFVGNQIRTSRTVEDNVFSNPSMANAPGPIEQREGASVVDEAHYRVDPGTLPVDTRTVLPDGERKSQQKAINELSADSANVAVSGADSVGAEETSSAPARKSSTSKSAAAKRTASKK